MVEYNIVSYCRLCKKRAVTKRGDIKRDYCEACQTKVNKKD